MKKYLRWQVPTRPWEAAAISRRGSIARYLGCVLISLVVWLTVAEHQDEHLGVFAVDIALGTVAFAVLHRRRQAPVAIAVFTALLSCFSAAAAGPATLAAVSVATRRNVPQVLVVGVVNLVAAQAFATYMEVEGTTYLLDLSVNTAFVAALMGWGMYIGSRRELLHNLRDRVDRAEAEQELRSSKTRGDERARIAREMHDVLAHRISQVSMLAGALSYRTDLSADAMRDSAGLIQQQANRALDDLRAVLGVLRDPSSGELLDRPQPTWADLPALIAETRRGGTHVTVTNTVEEADELPDATGRTAYRMVQEALTNARKHAPGAAVEINARGGPDDGISLEIRNPLGFGTGSSTPGAGLGLVGLTERAELGGGWIVHGREGAAFVLRGWLPWGA